MLDKKMQKEKKDPLCFEHVLFLAIVAQHIVLIYQD